MNQIKDIFENELNIGDEVVNVLIHKNEAKFRKGHIEDIQQTPRGVNVYVRNSETHRVTMKTTNAKCGYICKDILKYEWRKYDEKEQPSLFPELFF